MLTKEIILSILNASARANFETFLADPCETNFRIIDGDILAIQNFDKIVAAVTEQAIVINLMSIAPKQWGEAFAKMVDKLPKEEKSAPVKPPARQISAKPEDRRDNKRDAKAQTSEKGKGKPPARRAVVEEEEEV